MNDNKISLFAYSKNRSIFSDCSLVETIKCISELQAPGYTHVDFQDIESMLENCNHAVVTSTIGEGSNRITDAISKIFASSLWKEYDLQLSQKIFIKLLCARDTDNPVNVKEISELTKVTSNLPDSVDFEWIIGDDSSLGDKVKLILFGAFKKKSLFNHL